MKKYFLCLLLITTTLITFSQEVLFIGLYTKADAGTSYWCRGMDMVKQIVKTDAEAQKLVTDFKKEHANESPVTKIFKTSSVVLFEYIKDDKAFNCQYRVIGWKEGKNSDEARETLEKDKDRIKKEYNGQPKELYAWQPGPQTGLVIQQTYTLRGVAITFKEVQKEGMVTNVVAVIKNPRSDSAAAVGFITDDKRTAQDFKLQPGETLTVTLGKVKDIEVLVNILRMGKVEKDISYEITKEAKNYLRQKFIINQGKAEPRTSASWGTRQ